jgi:uncharacterized protein YdhG (YjbR/CyaY superfamily)
MKAASQSSTSVHDVEEYLSKVSEPARSTLLKLRETIRSLAPAEATEGFSYGVPAFKLKRGSLAGFAAYAEFCSYYPMSGRVITALKDELRNYGTSSGAIRFPIGKPLPAALVKKLVKARMAEIEAKK